MTRKAEIRQLMKATLAAAREEVLAAHSAQISAQVSAHAFWQSARRVALFAATPREVDLAALWARRGDRELVFPRLAERGMEFCVAAEPGALERGRYGIWQPGAQAPALALETLDLIIFPGLAFTREGARLGRGGGFYDRTLPANLRARRLGVCFAAQLLEALPIEPHDLRMEAVITERGVAGEC